MQKIKITKINTLFLLKWLQPPRWIKKNKILNSKIKSFKMLKATIPLIKALESKFNKKQLSF